MVRVGPVAAYLEIGILRPYGRDIVTQVVAECLPVELLPFEPSRVLGREGCVHSGLFLEQPDGLFAVIDAGSPALAVHPDTVDPILAGKFLELGNQQFVHIRPEYGCDGLAGIPVPVLDRPVGMEFHSPGIPDSGIMQIEGYASLRRNLPPDRKRIPHDVRNRIPDFGRIAGITGVSLAVNLDIVGMDHVQDRPDHFRSGVGTHSRAEGIGMEIKMDSEETLVAAESLLAA